MFSDQCCIEQQRRVTLGITRTFLSSAGKESVSKQRWSILIQERGTNPSLFFASGEIEKNTGLLVSRLVIDCNTVNDPVNALSSKYNELNFVNCDIQLVMDHTILYWIEIIPST
jgi:hypothetical protein